MDQARRSRPAFIVSDQVKDAEQIRRDEVRRDEVRRERAAPGGLAQTVSHASCRPNPALSLALASLTGKTRRATHHLANPVANQVGQSSAMAVYRKCRDLAQGRQAPEQVTQDGRKMFRVETA